MPSSAPPPAESPIHRELLAMCAPGAADEHLLVRLAANSAEIALIIQAALKPLAMVVEPSLADGKRALAIARTLLALIEASNALSRRVEGTLQAAAALRLQRRVGAGR